LIRIDIMGITISELYNPESKKRKRMARKHKFYRMFGYNPMLKAFGNKCAFCLTEFTDDSVEGVWESGFIGSTMFTEEHICSCCNQRWSYLRGYNRGNYKFDEANRKTMEALAPFREENARRLEEMQKLMK